MVKTTVEVEGMMCHNCERHVNEAIENAFEVEEVTSSFEEGTTVILSKEALDTEKVKAAIKEAGYDAFDATTEEVAEKKGFSLFHKK